MQKRYKELNELIANGCRVIILTTGRLHRLKILPATVEKAREKTEEQRPEENREEKLKVREKSGEGLEIIEAELRPDELL